MSRLFSNSEMASLRRQFFSQVVGQELSQETADALSDAATAYTKAVEALEEATEALEAAQSAVTSEDLDAALLDYATEVWVTAGFATQADIDAAFAEGVTEEVLVDGKTLKFVDGLYTGEVV